MRKYLIALALILGLVFAITNFETMENVWETVRVGDWRFLILAVFLQFVWVLNIAAEYRTIYASLGIVESLRVLFMQTLAGTFVNVVTPVAGMGSITVYLSEASRRGHSAAKAAIGSALFIFFDYSSVFSVVVLGLIVMIRRNRLTFYEVGAAFLLLGLAVIFGLLLYQGMRSTEAFEKLLLWGIRRANRLVSPFRRKELFSEQRARNFALAAHDGFQEIRHNPNNLLRPAALALSSKAVLISIFFLMFLAFRVPFTPGTLIAGFAVAYLFTLISPTPGGLGVVEGLLTLALVSLNVPFAKATVIMLAYRGITFWLPFFYGMLALRWLGRDPVPAA
jgi:hypothetical protein